VVLIQSKKSTRASLPVLKSHLYVRPLATPTIYEVVSAAQPPADTRITASSTILVNGTGLLGEVTRVQIGEATVTPTSPTDTQIAIDLTSVAGLRAGVQATQVMHQLLLGEPALPHRGLESNATAFVLHPSITTPATCSLAAGTLTVSTTPAVGKAQRVTLYLYEHAAPSTRPARAYSFQAPKDNGVTGADTDTAAVAFAVTNVVLGTYLAYVSVDGADSPLGLAAGAFDSPKVTVTP
jgi:hypothetical protein